jgi:hypothetical protein
MREKLVNEAGSALTGNPDFLAERGVRVIRTS